MSLSYSDRDCGISLERLSLVNHFDENSNIAKDGTRDFLRKYMETYAKWVDTIAKGVVA